MTTLSYLLAFRYLRGARAHSNIATMLYISLTGIIIGTFALALVVAVMNGFESVTTEKFQSIHPQVMIRAYGDDIDHERLATYVQEKFPAVAHTAPTATQHALIARNDEAPFVVALQGIDPVAEAHVTALEKKVVTHTTLAQALSHDHVIIGNKLARTLGADVGDSITLLLAPDEPKSRRITLQQQEAKIGGIFKTGIDEYDANIAFCSLEYMKKLFPESGVTQLNIKLEPHADEDNTIAHLAQDLALDVFSWKELYPALVSALKLEKYVMFFILALITLVASMNIISLLFMQITRKRGDIAILTAMGMQHQAIANIFIRMGMAISFIGCSVGLALAWLASWILKTFPFIELPDVYYVQHLPAHMTLTITLTVFVVVITLSAISVWLPVGRLKDINVSHVLRFEG